MKAYIIYPHQLYDKKIVQSFVSDLDIIFLVEEFLYFKYFDFHPLKIKFHQDSMHAYKLELEEYFEKNSIKSPKIIYIKSEELASTEKLIDILKEKYKISEIVTHDPTDDWLKTKTEKYIDKINKLEESEDRKIDIKYLNSPNFIFNESEIREYFAPDKNGKVTFFMNSFYINARKKLNILLEENGDPVGGKWNYDAENRKKIPNGEATPSEEDFEWKYTRGDAEKVLEIFLKEKFSNFGDYEDAIVADKNFLYHSTISTYLNVGLLDPKEVVKKALAYYEKNKNNPNKNKIVKLATVEGFVRQIIGWREYMRAVYVLKGREIRNKNFFNFDRKENDLPYTFWTGDTGNIVIDTTIKKTIKYAYNHHIERLMILGNYMLLKEYNPNHVYKWFMEMYIDAYDWVMVPNVYSMSQYADGGIITTKPYVSGSSYVLKMSDYDKKEGGAFSVTWALEWDNLYWDFIYKNREKFKNNFRMAMMVKMSIKRFKK
jgi:deoxyribodipyrimidine photolyase-related protein